MHKRQPELTVIRSLEVAREFSTQVVVLRGVTSIYGLQIASAADVRKLIDKRQTTAFTQWYDDIRNLDGDPTVKKLLREAEAQATAQISEIAVTVRHIQPIFQKMKGRFDNEELKELRKRTPYGEGTQRKLLDMMFEISRVLFKNTNVPKIQYPQLNLHAFKYFIFRYAMCMTLFYTRWVHYGNLSDDTDKLVNHIVDMHLAALATFFSGILSDDEMLVDVHREARLLLRMSGKAHLGS